MMTVAVKRIPVIHKAWVRVCPDSVIIIYALEQHATIRVQMAARYLFIA